MKQHWKEYFDYTYLGAYSLDDGKDKTLTIKSHKVEEVKGDNGRGEDCLVVYFEEEEKGMIMNRTNCRTIETLYRSPYPVDWYGKRITLFVDQVRAFGKVTDALRIRPVVPKTDAQAKKSDLKKKIRAALQSYKGDNIEAIRAELNKGRDDLQFLNDTLKQLTHAAV